MLTTRREGDPKHFTDNDNSASECHFENLLDEDFKDNNCKTTDIEQQRWNIFLEKHTNVKAYFHGHSNYNEFYVYKGVKGNLSLPVFRVDSPMKGEYSAKDESLLSFQVITMNAKKRTVTVQEYFWNRTPAAWGESKTILLQ